MSDPDDSTEKSNVMPMQFEGGEAEDTLRPALAQVATIRSDGGEPSVVVVLLAQDSTPGILISRMRINDMAACSAMLQTKVTREFNELWEDDAE